MYANLAKSIGGIVVCVYILLLAWRDQLGFYVHPRYHTFAVIISVIGVILLLIDIMLQLKNKPAKDKSRISLKKNYPDILFCNNYIISRIYIAAKTTFSKQPRAKRKPCDY